MTSLSYCVPAPARDVLSASGIPNLSKVFFISSGTSSHFVAFFFASAFWQAGPGGRGQDIFKGPGRQASKRGDEDNPDFRGPDQEDPGGR